MDTPFRTLLDLHRDATEREVSAALCELNDFYRTLPEERRAQSAARIVSLLLLAYDDPQSEMLYNAVFGLIAQRHEQGISLREALAVVACSPPAMGKVRRQGRNHLCMVTGKPVRNRITVNLAPAALRKEGSGFDLPIALAVLAGSHQVPAHRLLEHACFGELSPDGRVRPVAGTIAVAEGVRRAGPKLPICAARSAPGAPTPGNHRIPVPSLAPAVFRDPGTWRAGAATGPRASGTRRPPLARGGLPRRQRGAVHAVPRHVGQARQRVVVGRQLGGRRQVGGSARARAIAESATVPSSQGG